MIPGFIDLQVNGYRGIDFSGPGLTVAKIERVCKDMLERGTIAFCPAVITSSMEIYEKNLPLLVRAMDEGVEGARMLGFHLEGPFLSPENGTRGAHEREYIQLPSIKVFERFRELADDRILLLTLDPEREGAEKLIKHVVRTGPTVVSLGHTMADGNTIRRACDAGARAFTHLGNGIPTTIERHKNPIWPALAEERLTCFCISDGHHIPSDFLKVCLRVKGPQRIIITSDVVQWGGQPAGIHQFHGMTLAVEEDGWVHQAGTTQMAGSGSVMLQCMNFLAKQNFLTEEELRLVGFANALELLGLDETVLGEDLKPVVRFDGRAFSVVQ